jgi:hypothetical protein
VIGFFFVFPPPPLPDETDWLWSRAWTASGVHLPRLDAGGGGGFSVVCRP